MEAATAAVVGAVGVLVGGYRPGLAVVSRLRSVSEIMGIGGICPGSYVMCGV